MPPTIPLVRYAGFWAARWAGDDAERIERMFEARIALTPLDAKADGETVCDPDRIVELC